MSSVTPSEGYNSYYMKHLSEIEDDLKQEHARTEQRSRERLEEIEQKYAESTQKNEERSSEAVERIRNDSQESVIRSKESDRAELDKFKRQNYDKFGRDRTNEADTLRSQLNSTLESSRLQHENDMTRLADTEKGHAAHSEAMSKNYSEKLERTVQAAHDSAAESFHEAFESGKSAVDQQRAQANKRYEELNRDKMNEQQYQRRNTQKIVEDSQRDINNQKQHADKSVEQRLNAGNRANLERIENAAKRTQEVHNEETRQLRNKINDLVTAEDNYVKEKGQGRSDAIKEYENDWRTREQVVQDTNSREIAKMKEQATKADSYNAHLNDRNLHSRDTFYTGLIAKTSAESHAEQKELTERYEKSNDVLEKRMKSDNAHAQNLLEAERFNSGEQRSEALKNQAMLYQETMKNQRKHDQDEVQALQKELKNRSNPEDTSVISPAVEASVRRSVVREYEKTLAFEAERNKRLVDAIQSSSSDRFQNAELEHKSLLTKREQMNQGERHEEKARFVDHVQETEQLKDQAIRSRDYEHDKETTNLNRSFTQMNIRQRNEYEGMIQTIKDDAATRLSAVRQESEFASKMAHRAFSLKQSELIRDYEKKLADQKVDFDNRVDDIKGQAQSTLRESERRTKVALDDQSRSYEQRITQLEAQQKERDRTVAQNYEDQLEKVKRANALQQKKS